MSYDDVRYQSKPLHQSVGAQKFIYNEDPPQALPDAHSPSLYAAQQGRRVSFDARRRQEMVHQELASHEAHSQGLAPRSPCPSSHAQQFHSVPARAGSVQQLPQAKASHYPGPKLTPLQPKANLQPKFSSAASLPGTFEAAVTDVQQTQSLPHYQHWDQLASPKAVPHQGMNSFPAAVRQQIPTQPLPTSVQGRDISYPRTKHVLPPSPTGRIGAG